MVAVAEHFEQRAAGFLLLKELEYFHRALSNPARPFVAVLGGAKVSDKILVMRNLLDKVDRLIVGGAMAYTFMRSQGIGVGDSRVEEDKLDIASGIVAAAAQKDVDLLLPVDHICGRAFDAATTPEVGLRRPSTMSANVVLPDPEGPTKPSDSPFLRTRPMSFNAAPSPLG